MSSTTLLRATRALLGVLFLVPSGIRAAETDPFRRSVAELMASAERPRKRPQARASPPPRAAQPSRQPPGVPADGLDSRGPGGSPAHRFALRPADAGRQLPRRHARGHGRVSAGHLGRGGPDAVSRRRERPDPHFREGHGGCRRRAQREHGPFFDTVRNGNPPARRTSVTTGSPPAGSSPSTTSTPRSPTTGSSSPSPTRRPTASSRTRRSGRTSSSSTTWQLRPATRISSSTPPRSGSTSTV